MSSKEIVYEKSIMNELKKMLNSEVNIRKIERQLDIVCPRIVVWRVDWTLLRLSARALQGYESLQEHLYLHDETSTVWREQRLSSVV